MALIDFILNVVALLLWLNWRSFRSDPLNRSTPATLVGTLRRAEARRLKGWQWLAGLVLLLVLRAFLYSGIGAPVHWTPKLNLGLVVPAFRSDRLPAELLYSTVSFARLWLIFYFWLLVLAAVNHRVIEPDPLLKLLRFHLGRLARWPWPVQILLPVLFVTGFWLALHPAFVHLGLASRTTSTAHLIGQGLLIASCLFLTLKYVLPVFLFLHLVSSYVYLGPSPLSEFVSATSRNLLRPLKGLRLGKFDLAPVAGILLVLLLLHWLPMGLLALVAKGDLTLWPP
jgi:hypothetical protein